MSSNSSIEWTDTTWNPVVGCTMVSPGCANCYAETMSNRLRGMAIADEIAGKNPGRKTHYLKVINKDGRWNGRVELVPEALPDPFKWRKPRRVFVNSMSDLFHEDVPLEFIDLVFAVMASTPQHTYQVLTKRPERMADYLTRHNGGRYQLGVLKAAHKIPGQQGISGGWSYPLPNVWLGTSPCNQATADKLIPELLKCPAAVRFLSCEPLLAPLDLKPWLGFLPLESSAARYLEQMTGVARLHWVIVGGESGPKARPCNIEWIRDIVQQCKAAGVPCFVKQLGSRPIASIADIAAQVGDEDDDTDNLDDYPINNKKGGDMDEWPEDLRVREMPQTTAGSAA